MMRSRLFIGCGLICLAAAVPARHVAAQLPPAPVYAADDAEETLTGMGPFEFAPVPFSGNVGAPRSAVPETRLGVALHWMTARESEGEFTGAADMMSLLVEGHLALFDVVEVGVDIEVLQYVGTSVEGPGVDRSDSDEEFGFITPRAKVAFLSTDMFTLAGGVGIALPTASHDFWDNATPLSFDPGVYAAVRPLDILSINVSLPVVVGAVIPDEGDTEFDTFFAPTIGVAVRPIDLVAGFVDLQTLIWLDPTDPSPGTDGPDSLRLMNLIIGARSQFLPFMMGEIGAIIPLAGDLAGEGDSDGLDFGLGVRLVATPDFF